MTKICIHVFANDTKTMETKIKSPKEIATKNELTLIRERWFTEFGPNENMMDSEQEH